MSMLFLLELTRSKRLRSYTAPAGNSVWRSPAGVFRLETMTGKGGAGSPGGTYPDERVRIDAATVQAVNTNGNGPFPVLSWEGVFSYVSSLRSEVNAGGSGSNSTGFLGYTGYTGDGTAFWDFDPVSWQNAVAGSATSATSGWGSGFIIAGSNGTAWVAYTRKGSSYGPSTGNPTTFGSLQTFTGGVGGPASTSVRSGTAIQPNTNYNLSVASGGSLSFTWLE